MIKKIISYFQKSSAAKQKDRVTKTHNNIHIRVQYHRYDPNTPHASHGYLLMGYNNKTNRLEMLDSHDILRAVEWAELYDIQIPGTAYKSIWELINPTAVGNICI